MSYVLKRTFFFLFCFGVRVKQATQHKSNVANHGHFAIFWEGSLKQENMPGGKICFYFCFFFYQFRHFTGSPFAPKIYTWNGPEILNVEHFRGLSTFVDLGMICFAPWCSESAVESKDFNLCNQMPCGSPGSDFG